MSDSPRSFLRLSALLLAVLPFLSGCLHYDERGTIATDGSGELRVVYSMGPGGELDKEKQDEVRSELVAVEGIEILDDIDSTDGDTTWVGMRLRFSSLAALQAIDTILPLKGMFQGVALRQDEAGTWVFSRTVRLPPAPTEGVDLPRLRQVLTWVVPGRVLGADKLARWSEGDNTVVWTLPNDGSAGASADLEVRWIDGDVVRLSLPWGWIGAGAGVLALVVLMLILMRRKGAKSAGISAPSSPESSGATPSREPLPAVDPLSVAGASPSADALLAGSPADVSPPQPGTEPATPMPAPAIKPRRFWSRYFLSPSLLLAAFGLFALAPVVNVSCMGRTQQMTGWQLAHQSPEYRSQLAEMQDMAETVGSGEDFRDKSLDEAASGAGRSHAANDVTYFLWSILVVAGLCVIVPWERAQGLVAVLHGGGLVAFQYFLGQGMAKPIPEVAKFLKIEPLVSWHIVHLLLVLAVLSGLWSIVSSLRGSKARKGWVPSIVVLVLSVLPLVVFLIGKDAASGPLDGAEVDTTSVFEMPVDTAAVGGEETEAAEGGDALEPFVDSRDDRTYRVVNGPSGPWLGRNLSYVADSSWCFPAPGVDCEREGRLYTWEAAEQACPAGWRLPTLQEVEQLAGSVGEVALLRAGPVGTEDSDPGMALVATGWGGADGSWNDHGRTISLWVTPPGRDEGPFIWQIDAGDRIGTGPTSADSRHGVRCVSEGE